MTRPPGVRTLLTAATVGVALLALALAAVLTGPLVRSAAEDAARQSLARDADVVARLPLTERLSERDPVRATRERRGLLVGLVEPDGSARGAGLALSDTDRQRALAGARVSTSGRLAGEPVLLEARRLDNGVVVVLADPASSVDEGVAALRRRLLLALLLGLVVALVAGTFVARRLSRPLAQVAGTARRLTDGERGVATEPTGGPREVSEVADALRRLDEALATSEDRQRRFLLSVSHELRTPLTALRGWSESLVDGAVAPDELPEVGATMVQEATRMERYVADLLALSRLEADDFTLAVTEVDLPALLAEGARAWADRVARAGAALDVVATPGLRLRTDPGRVRQILDVLTDNALRVGAPGDRVVWEARPGPAGARLEVRDSGPGLTEDDRAVAFEPGALHDRYAGQRPVGHGLGLAIAHRLVVRLGGAIRVEPAPEGGAAFVLDLPDTA
ncbi:HAMP domain-containing histidine kinase [Nocardioides anomalus]|uniref:histidine kinase n=1 Tax=Nocardioides anomalus TaxID=2712223 RepID=A0A6G6WFH4_9ACTN|nr:HAMP domain-containing sensor histidine kinase [Nocardioides anomalus]QIG43956.1 HAMP domain-containing histidine kinase [Nocardioides anomalus]